MKKLFLTLAITSALGLTACMPDGNDAPASSQDQVQIPVARVAFDPGNGVLPVPSDILLGGTTDGTLNIPVADPTNFGDPQNAINALDGWSTAMPLTFDFTLPDGVDINASSVQAPGSVRVFKVVMGGDTRDSDCMTAPAGTACKFVGELQHGVDFTVMFSGGQVQVIPLRPYEPQTGYIATLTNAIEDDMGRPVRPSSTYYLLSQPRSEAPVGADGGQEAQLQGIINSHLAVLAQGGVNTESVIYSSHFTTQSVGQVLGAAKQLLLRDDLRPTMSAAPLGVTAANLLGIPAEAGANYLIANSAQVYAGSVNLPYYSPVPSAANPTAPLNGNWQAAAVSPISILLGFQSGALSVEDLAAIGVNPAQLQNPASLAGQVPYSAAAGTALETLDRFRHLTKFNPIPAPQAVQPVPLMMSVPDLDTVNMVRVGSGLEPFASVPENGWPVVIFQHGITGDKTNFLPIAGALAVSGHAVVAIDHPLHGDRGFEITNAAGDVVRVINATTGKGGSPTDYLNLASLLTARDNLRQSVADLLGLRVALNFSNAAATGLINPTDVKFVGHSLGAIAGTNFVAIANTPLTGDAAAAQGLFQVQQATLGMPGGGIAPFLVASERFGPVIGGQIAFQSFPSFQNFAVQEAMSEGIDPQSLAFMDFLPVAYGRFYAGGVASAADQAALQATLAQFQFAAQTVVDSGDPINYAAAVRATETPIYLIQANGDKVVPNSTAHPLGGTAPLIRALGLPFATGPQESEDAISAAVRYVGAGHSSLLNPADADANPDTRAAITADMQQSIGFWFESYGRVLNISSSLVQQ